MATLDAKLRLTLDRVRRIPAILGLRTYTCFMRKRTWSGDRAGLGTKTDVDIDITVYDGYAPRIRQLTQKDVIASGGLYSDQDFELTFTPSYTVDAISGGMPITNFEPVSGSLPTEIFFNIKGQNLGVNGSWYKKKSQTIDSNLTYQIIISKTAEQL